MAAIEPKPMRTVSDDSHSAMNSHEVPVHPEVAQLARKIEGEQAAHGISIAFEDLLIGSTALHLGYSVATLNALSIDTRSFCRSALKYAK